MALRGARGGRDGRSSWNGWRGHGLAQSRDTLRVCLVALAEKRERRFTPMTATRMDADGRLKEEGLTRQVIAAFFYAYNRLGGNSNKPMLAAE